MTSLAKYQNPSFRRLILIGLALVALSLLLVFQGQVYAGCDNPTSTQEAVQCGGSVTGQNNSQQRIENTIREVINILTIIVGMASVIVIIIAAIIFVTSAGDSQRAGKARMAVIFALVGLILAALAQAIVAFTISRTA